MAHNQIALCASQLRQLSTRRNSGKQSNSANRALFRLDLALYANYAGDFVPGNQQARRVQRPDSYASPCRGLLPIGSGTAG